MQKTICDRCGKEWEVRKTTFPIIGDEVRLFTNEPQLYITGYDLCHECHTYICDMIKKEIGK